MGSAGSLLQSSETRTEAEWHAVLGGTKLDTREKRTLPQLLTLAKDEVVARKDAEIAGLREELAALKGDGSDMTGLPAVLRDFTPLAMVDDVAAIAEGPELEAAERAALADPRRGGSATSSAGNEDFEKVYNSVFDFIANNDAAGLAAFRASMAALECPGAAARPQRGGGARLDELYRDAARAKPRFEAALKAVIAALPFEVRGDTAFPPFLKRTPRVVEKAVFKGDDFACCGVNDFVRAMVVVGTLGELGQLVDAVARSPKLVVVRAKNRIDEPSDGGWRDVLLNVYHRDDTKKHVCEVQGCVEQMLKARKGLPGHVVWRAQRRRAPPRAAPGRRGVLTDLTAAEGRASLAAAELRAGASTAPRAPRSSGRRASRSGRWRGGLQQRRPRRRRLRRRRRRRRDPRAVLRAHGRPRLGETGRLGHEEAARRLGRVKTSAATGHVEGLKLEGNKLGGGTLADALALLAPLAPTLRSLNLKRNKLGGAIPPTIAAFTEVHTLALAGMDLKGDVPSEITALANLHEFDASQNKFSDPEVARARELKGKLPACQYFIMGR
ncbi:hypothetical protein JL720_14058 [Aureococcus anophagefferens]|nr:hypothetical protein JL720_14058 [Aureococcus anophagefferens]